MHPVVPSADGKLHIRQTLPFQFTGSGSEFFKIWIVNLCLTVVTLGIYSAWAKVRTNRYFYGNTRIDGSSFEYLADPFAILKGRIIAVVLLMLFSYSQNLSPFLTGALLGLVIVILPWLITRALVFRARNTAWRNIRFNFHGDYAQAMINFIVLPLASVITLGLLLPYTLHRQKAWLVSHSSLGNTRFTWHTPLRDFYKLIGLLLLVAIAISALLTIGAISTGVGMLTNIATDPGQALSVFALIYLVMIAVYAYLYAYYTAHMTNLVYNGAFLESQSFRANLNPWSLCMLNITNTVGIMLTLGLFIPWAKVRSARYLADHLSLISGDSLARFVADQQANSHALGEEMGEVFDIDIGL